MSTYNPYAYRSYIGSSNTSNNKKVNKPERMNNQQATATGRMIIVISVVILIVMSLFLFRATASTSDGVLPLESEMMISVGNGDTLWDIAKLHYTGQSDIGYIVFLIKDRNQLNSSEIYPGQQLILPSL